MRGRSDHRAVGVVISLLLIAAVAGLLVAPGLLVLWLVVAGLSGGSSLVLALALVGERSPSAADAGRLSGMAQSVGYLLAAAGPWGAGVLFALTGRWSYPLLAVIAVAVVQLGLSLLAGRDRLTTHPTQRLDQGVQHFGDQWGLAPRGHGHCADVPHAELVDVDEAQSRTLLGGERQGRDDGGAKTGFDEGQDGGELFTDVRRSQRQAGRAADPVQDEVHRCSRRAADPRPVRQVLETARHRPPGRHRDPIAVIEEPGVPEAGPGRPVGQVLVLDQRHVEVPAAQPRQRHSLAGFVHPHLYARCALFESADRRHDQPGHHRGVRPDVRGTAEPLGHGVDVFGGVRHHLGEAAPVRGEALPGGGQPQRSLPTAVKPVDQHQTGLAFEPSQVLRDAGRSQMELTSGGADPAGGGNRPQDQQPIR